MSTPMAVRLENSLSVFRLDHPFKRHQRTEGATLAQ